VATFRPSVRPFVRPQNVSSISMKFGIQVVLDERWKKDNDHARIQGQGQGQEQSRKFDRFGPFSKSISSPIYNRAGIWPRILKLGGQYLKFTQSGFWNSSSFSVTWPLNFGPLIFSTSCDLYQTWCICSTRWEMHNGMTLTRIQGQGQGHCPSGSRPSVSVRD